MHEFFGRLIGARVDKPSHHGFYEHVPCIVHVAGRALKLPIAQTSEFLVGFHVYGVVRIALKILLRRGHAQLVLFIGHPILGRQDPRFQLVDYNL